MRLRVALCQAAIAAAKAIREVDPEARMVHMDPLVHVVASRDRPDQIEAARHETCVDTFLAWDMLCGREHPELGGSPDILDHDLPRRRYGQPDRRHRLNGILTASSS